MTLNAYLHISFHVLCLLGYGTLAHAQDNNQHETSSISISAGRAIFSVGESEGIHGEVLPKQYMVAQDNDGSLIYFISSEDLLKAFDPSDLLAAVVIHHMYGGLSPLIEQECACHATIDLTIKETIKTQKTNPLKLGKSYEAKLRQCVQTLASANTTVYPREMIFGRALPMESSFSNSILNGIDVCESRRELIFRLMSRKNKANADMDGSGAAQIEIIKQKPVSQVPTIKGSNRTIKPSKPLPVAEELYPNPDMEKIFEQDPGIRAHADEIANNSAAARLSTKAKIASECSEYKRIETKKLRDSIRLQKKKLSRTELKALEEKLTSSVDCSADALRLKIRGDEYEFYRQIFIKEATYILSKRGSRGRIGDVLANLGKTKQRLKKSIAICTNRKTKEIDSKCLQKKGFEDSDPGKLDALATPRIANQIQLVKSRFKVLADEKYKFRYESQAAELDGTFYTRGRPPENLEPTDRLYGKTCGDSMVRNAPTGQSIAQLILDLRKLVKFDACSYESHSWGAYSVDFTLDDSRNDSRGFYEHKEAMDFFETLYTLAAAQGIQWHALYNDFSVAKEFNEKHGTKCISFQWRHSPEPYVEHIHIDFYPFRLVASSEKVTSIDGGSGDQGLKPGPNDPSGAQKLTPAPMKKMTPSSTAASGPLPRLPVDLALPPTPNVNADSVERSDGTESTGPDGDQAKTE